MPTPSPPPGELWRHEVKWDGIRSIVTVREGQVHMTTRSGADCTARFPEIAGSHLADFDDLVVDGEVIALLDGRPDFRSVMHRLAPSGGRQRRSATLAGDASHAAAAVRFVAFDVLRAAAHDLTRMPWQARRELLENAGIHGGVIDVPPTYTDGAALFRSTREQGLEGVVSKRIDAIYRPGVRTEDWLKSVHRHTGSFVVGGWRPVAGTVGSLGALLVGEMREGDLRYCGRVGTGLSAASGHLLLEWLTPMPESPFTHPGDDVPPADIEGTHWVEPRTVVDVT